MSEFTEYEQRVAKTDQTTWLGKLAWYTVSDMCVSHEDVVKGLTKVGLTSAIPPYPKDFDVFRRVSTNAARKKVPVPAAYKTVDSHGNETTFDNYLIREVAGRGEDIVVRRIVVETVNRLGKKLSYEQLLDVNFNKNTSAITTSVLPTNDSVRYPAVDEIVNSIRNEFAAWQGKLNAYSIREFIRRMVLGMEATCVRPGGGVYFLQENKTSQVSALEEFVNDLPGGEAVFHTLPLIDDRKQREMVRRAYEAETSDAIDTIMAEIEDIRANNKRLSADRYARMVTDYQELVAKTQQYGDLLETTLGETNSRLQLFQTQVVSLAGMVR